MDLVETGDHYVLGADLSGLSEEDINIQLQENVLTVSGEGKPEHETKQEGYYRLERAFGGSDAQANSREPEPALA